MQKKINQKTGAAKRTRSAGPAAAAAKHSGAAKSAGAAAKRTGARAARRRRPGGVSGLVLRLSALMSTPRGIAAVVGGFLALALVIAAVGFALTRTGSRPDVVREPGQTVQETIAAADAQATPAPAEPTPEPRPDETWRDGQYAPEPLGDGYLPVFIRAEREDKVIAITVDDCYQAENLREAMQLADSVGGKLTIFPIGELMEREALQQALRDARAEGHEIENHTWSHDSLYNLSNAKLAAHVFNQDRALDFVLNENYDSHFLRPRGGDDRNDLRTHSYINQLGYYGIAHWSVSGTDLKIEKIRQSLGPGEVYLFHCVESDLEKLRDFIPYAAQQGYRLVTLNEMFGYAENYSEPLTDDPKTREVVQLEPYTRDYKTLRATMYDYAAYEVQAALKKQGYLKGDPDGIYGKGTAKRAAEWQKANGYKADGVLTPEQQRKLLGVD